MASKNKTTFPTRTQDTISQHELTLLAIGQNQVAQFTAACQRREGDIVSRLKAGAVVEPGRFFLEGTSVEVRS